MRSLQLYLGVLALLLPLPACLSDNASPTHGLPQQLDDLDSPASIVQDSFYTYIANWGKDINPAIYDEDGYISRYLRNGRILEKLFIPLLHAPHSLAIQDHVLYFCDRKRVRGFDLNNACLVFDLELDAPEATYLGDLTFVRPDLLLVSLPEIDELRYINLKDRTAGTLTVYPSLTAPMYLEWEEDEKRLWIMQGEVAKEKEIGYLELGELPYVYRPQSTVKGFFRAMHLQDSHELWLSSWGDFGKEGRLFTWDSQDTKLVPMALSEKIGGPADFCVDTRQQVIWIPALMENKVYLEPINTDHD